MKLGGTAFISIIALLLEGCLTLKGSGKTQVKGGSSTFFKLRIATDSANVTNATLTVCVVPLPACPKAFLLPNKGKRGFLCTRRIDF